jgi:hypothetical protein
LELAAELNYTKSYYAKSYPVKKEIKDDEGSQVQRPTSKTKPTSRIRGTIRLSRLSIGPPLWMPTPLSFYHRRLVIEDYLRLDVGDAVVVLISPKHPAFLTWALLLHAYYTDLPLAPIQFQKKRRLYLFYGIPLTVKAIQKGKSFTTYHNGLSFDAFQSLTTVAGGGALVLSTCNSNIDIQLKYCEVFNSHPPESTDLSTTWKHISGRTRSRKTWKRSLSWAA